jgi:hypothetical protein
MAKTHFTRILKTAQVKDVVKMLNNSCGTAFPIPKAKDERFEIKSPDGDIVFSGLYNGSVWLCRMHKEVFTQS